ncbi:GroES-like protein [Trametes elegans]|nr:GroES-like protein [Trametes elegans]
MLRAVSDASNDVVIDVNPRYAEVSLLYKPSTPYVVGETPVPHPAPNEILVKIIAVGLNPFDAAVVDPPHSSIIAIWPKVAGEDGAGDVVEVGAGVTRFKVGDRVLFEGGGLDVNTHATFQQYAVVPDDQAAIIPEKITYDEAASIPLALNTVVLSVYNQSPLPEIQSLRLKPVWEPEGAKEYAGKPALVVGGATSVGQYAIQLAKLAGHNPIITTASPHNASLLTSLGATHVLDRARPSESILAELPSLTGGRLIEYAFLAVEVPDAMLLAVRALAPGGALGSVIPPAMAPLFPEEVVRPGDGKRVGFVFADTRQPHTRDTSAALYQQITGWLEQGVLKPNPIEVLPNGLAGINNGLARLKNNKVSGHKLIAHPQETL